MKPLTFLQKNNLKLIGIGFIVFFTIMINFYLLNKVISNSGSEIEFVNKTDKKLY